MKKSNCSKINVYSTIFQALFLSASMKKVLYPFISVLSGKWWYFFPLFKVQWMLVDITLSLAYRKMVKNSSQVCLSWVMLLVCWLLDLDTRRREFQQIDPENKVRWINMSIFDVKNQRIFLFLFFAISHPPNLILKCVLRNACHASQMKWNCCVHVSGILVMARVASGTTTKKFKRWNVRGYGRDRKKLDWSVCF